MAYVNERMPPLDGLWVTCPSLAFLAITWTFTKVINQNAAVFWMLSIHSVMMEKADYTAEYTLMN
jgi:hypothetical protein